MHAYGCNVVQYNATTYVRTVVLRLRAAVGRIWKRRLQSAEILGWTDGSWIWELLRCYPAENLLHLHACMQHHREYVSYVLYMYVAALHAAEMQNTPISYQYSIYGVLKLKRDGFGKAELRRSYLGWSKSRMSMHARRPARPMVQHNINI